MVFGVWCLFVFFFLVDCFFPRTATQSLASQPVLVHEVISSQVQIFLILAEFHEVSVSSVPMNSCGFRFFG